MPKKQTFESYEEKLKILERVNQNFAMWDDHLIENVVEIEEYEEYDSLSVEEFKNDMKLEYINKGPIQDESNNEDTVYNLSRKIVHFIFRNGIIEDMHAGSYSYDEYSKIPENTPIETISQLTDQDMKALNKYLLDRMGYIIHLIQKAEYTKLHYLLDKYEYYGDDWDQPNIDKIDEEINSLILIENGFSDK